MKKKQNSLFGYRWEFMVILSTVSEKTSNKNRRNDFNSNSSKKKHYTCTQSFDVSVPAHRTACECALSPLFVYVYTYYTVKLPLIWLFACALFTHNNNCVVEWKVINVATIQHVAYFIYYSLSAAFRRTHCCHNRHHHHRQRKHIVHSYTFERVYANFYVIFLLQIWYVQYVHINVDFYMKIAFKSLYLSRWQFPFYVHLLTVCVRACVFFVASSNDENMEMCSKRNCFARLCTITKARKNSSYKSAQKISYYIFISITNSTVCLSKCVCLQDHVYNNI